MCYYTVLTASEYGQVIDSEYDCDFYGEKDDTMNHELLFSQGCVVWGWCVRGCTCVTAPDCSLQTGLIFVHAGFCSRTAFVLVTLRRYVPAQLDNI